MSLTAYGAHAKEALEAAETEISRLDKLLSISSESSDIYQVNQNGSGELSEEDVYKRQHLNRFHRQNRCPILCRQC